MLKPNHFVVAARAMLALLLILLIGTVSAPSQVGAVLAYCATVALFVSFPRVRSGDLALIALLIATLTGAVGALDHGILSVARLTPLLVAVAAAVMPFKLGQVRQFAARNGYRTFADRREHDRRRRARATEVPITIDVAPARTALGVGRR